MDGGSDSDSDPFLEESSSEEEDNDEEFYEDEEDEELLNVKLQGIKENEPDLTGFTASGNYERIQNMTDDEWEQLGRDISNNTHLEDVTLYEGALSDHKMSFLFRGLTRSSSITGMQLYDNELSVAGVRSMVPFLQNANNLTQLDLDDNDIQSEGFNLLFRALRGSPIEMLYCSNCDIESIEIDNDYFPKHLKYLDLFGNNINTDGCRGLRKLLQGGDTTLTTLRLEDNNIDDEGVAILVDALQNNTSLGTLDLTGNEQTN